MKLRSFLLRLGWRSLRSALASIWRMRSRVTLKPWPTSSRAVVGGILSDRFGRATSAAAIFALSGAISWGIGWMTGFPWAVIIAVTVVYGWAIAADSAIYSTAITEVAEQGRLGSTLAVHSFLGFLGGVIGPIIVGGILDVAPESIGWGLGFSFVGGR